MSVFTGKKLNERGAALFVVLALIVALSALAVISVDRSTTDVELSYNQLHKDQAFYIAEAGMEHAMVKLFNDKTWRTGFPYQPLGEGFYVVTLKDSTAVPALLDTIVVTSRALVGAVVGEIEVHVIKVDLKPFKYSMFSGTDLTMRQTSCTDSYNSDSGTYATTYDSLGADVGSNGTVTMSQDATVGGDVTSAVEGGLILDSGFVLGDTASGIPPEDMDGADSSKFDYAIANNGAPTGFSGSGYAYNSATGDLTINTSSTLELSSGVYYFNDMTLMDSARITVAPGAEIEIYVNGAIDMKHQSSMNIGGKPSDYQVFSRGPTFDMYHESEFWGAFYGPQTDFEAHQLIDYYGSLIAGSVSLFQDVCIHYDRSLMKIGWEGDYGVIAWKEN